MPRYRESKTSRDDKIQIIIQIIIALLIIIAVITIVINTFKSHERH